jgi:hypothetical protein
VRIAIGILVFVLILGGVVALLRVLANPPPAKDEGMLEDVSAEELRYSCVVCGTEIRMLRKPKGDVKAPRHCGESMELRR